MGCSVSAHDSITGLSCIGAACANLTPFTIKRSPFLDESHINETRYGNMEAPFVLSIDLQNTLTNFFEHAPQARTLVVSKNDLLERR